MGPPIAFPRKWQIQYNPRMTPPGSKGKKPMKLKPRRRGEPDTPGTEPKTYKLPLAVILEIRKAASLYGSQGRAVQVGSEILVRMARPLPPSAAVTAAGHASIVTARLRTHALDRHRIGLAEWISFRHCRRRDASETPHDLDSVHLFSCAADHILTR